VLPWSDDWSAGSAGRASRRSSPLFVALYMLFYSLTPSKYRWPLPEMAGRAFTALWWLRHRDAAASCWRLLGGYDRTYGSLAGVMIACSSSGWSGSAWSIGAHSTRHWRKPRGRRKGAPAEATEE
jgi:membrane protein